LDLLITNKGEFLPLESRLMTASALALKDQGATTNGSYCSGRRRRRLATPTVVSAAREVWHGGSGAILLVTLNLVQVLWGLMPMSFANARRHCLPLL